MGHSYNAFMGIEYDRDSGKLQPLKPVVPPAVEARAMLAVGTVQMTAGEAELAVLRDFYTQILGMTCVEQTDTTLRLTLHRRDVLLTRPAADAPLPRGRAAFQITAFGAALQALEARRIKVDLTHMDSGLSRMAFVTDPAGNWLFLFETRPF